MSSTDIIEKLRAELVGLSGAARLGGLTRLGQALAQRYWQVGPGSPAGLPHLNAAIEAMDEAYGYLAADDGIRGQLAGQLGMLLGARHTAHTGTEQDRENGIRRLEEALTVPHLPPMLRAMDQVLLGQLYLSRVTTVLQSPGTAMSLMTGGAPPDAVVNADRAADCFRKILDEPATDEITEAAESMLALAETMQTMFGGTGAGLDLQRLMEAAAAMQRLQDRFARGGTPGPGLPAPGSFLSFSDFQTIMNMDPLDRPVTVVQQAEPAPEPAASPQPPVAPTQIDCGQLRSSLHDKLSGTGPAAPIWASAGALLLPAAPTPTVQVVDEVVALARMIVDAEDGAEDTDAGSVAVDWFVLAVVLYLRDRLDEGGDHADRLAGAECLLTAVEKVPIDHPAATTMLLALGAFLEEEKPLGGVLDALADGFADRLDAAIATGVAKDAAELASLHALRCLCRAASAMAEFQRAAVPPAYPWQATLKAAARAAG